MDLLLYVLTVALWLASAWVAACIYLTIRYGGDGVKYEVGLFRINEDESYELVKAIGCVRFPTAYLIVGARPWLRVISWCETENETVMIRFSNSKALGVALAGPLKQALSRKYNI